MSGQGQNIKTNIYYNTNLLNDPVIDNKYINLNSSNNGIFIHNNNTINTIFAIIDTDDNSYKLINDELFSDFQNITTTLLINGFSLLKFNPIDITSDFSMFKEIDSNKKVNLYELFILTDTTENNKIQTYLTNKYQKNLHTFINFDNMTNIHVYLLFHNILNSFPYMNICGDNNNVLKAINISDNSKNYPNSNLSYYATQNNNIDILSIPKIAPINTNKLEICGFENGILKPVIEFTNKIDNTNIELNINSKCNINDNINASGTLVCEGGLTGDVTGDVTGNVTGAESILNTDGRRIVDSLSGCVTLGNTTEFTTIFGTRSIQNEDNRILAYYNIANKVLELGNGTDTISLSKATLFEPKIFDTNTTSGNTYNIVSGTLTASRNIILPILTGNDTVVFESQSQLLTNKTLTSPIITSPTITGTLTAGEVTGTSGQVLKSTGSGIVWADESGGGGGSSVWNQIGGNSPDIYYNTGYVGIGTNNPAVPFHVEGGTGTQMMCTGAPRGLFIQTTTGPDYAYSSFVFRALNNASSGLSVYNDGNVVIGKTPIQNPSTISGSRLFFGGSSFPDMYHIGAGNGLDNDDGGDYANSKLDLTWYTGIRIAAGTSYGGVRIFKQDSVRDELLFSVGKGSNDTIVESGNLGVGINPVAKLDVNGKIIARGHIGKFYANCDLDIHDLKYKYFAQKPSDNSSDPPGLHIYNTGANATGAGSNHSDRPSNGIYLHQSNLNSAGWLIHIEDHSAATGSAATTSYPYLIFKSDNLPSGYNIPNTQLSAGNLYTRGYIGWWLDTASLSFTGQHRCVPNNINYYNTINDYIGLIVYATGDYKTYDNQNSILHSDNQAITINDTLPVIELTNKKKDKAVFGIISDKEEDDRHFSAGAFCTPVNNENDDKRLYINSIGEGAIWIVNTNGNLENGDYIQSSDVIGMGEKQDDDFLHNYTVAKITCNCDFDINSTKYKCESFVDIVSGNTYLKAFVGCTYHCG